MHFVNSTELKTLYTALAASLSERGRRQFAGAAVKASGRRHISFVARSLGMSRNTVMASLKEMGTAGTDWPASAYARGVVGVSN